MSTLLSALVVAHNEEEQLEACLNSLHFADQLVVVLDRCTDRSKEIAQAFEEKFDLTIIEGAWPIEGDRRNAGLDACHGQWIIELDADERVTPDLAQEITSKLPTATAGYFLLPFDNYVGERLVRYGWGCSWGVSAAPRLHAKGHKRWGRQRVHPSIELKGPRQEMQGRIDHYVDRDITDMIKRLNSYSTAKAKDIRDQPDGIGYARNIRRIFSRFLKCYIGRKGYKEGKYGFLIALMAALYPIMSYLKANLEDS